MKLRNKLTATIILVVLSTIGLSFYVIHDRTNEEFEHFLQQKEEEMNQLDPLGIIPRTPRGVAWKLRENSPEQRFIKTTEQSLLLTGFVGIILSILVGFLLSNFLLTKIVLLKQAIVEYKEKRKHLSLPKSRADEIDELAQSYNELIENLEKQEIIRKDFFIDLSHEVRTPITVIRGYMEGLFDGVFQPSEEIYVKVLSELERMNHLLSQMSNMAKLESGQIELHKTSVDLKDICTNVCETFDQKAKEHHLSLQTTGERVVEGDAERIKQIVINLVSNAVCYGDSGTDIVMTIYPEGGTLFDIRNSAKNLSKEALEKVFHRFVRLDQARSYDSGEPHLGVGLNIVRKLVEAHGWKVRAEKKDEKVIFIVEK